MSIKFSGAFVVALALFVTAPVAATECHDNYVDGVEPSIVRPSIAQSSLILCYDSFAVLHSGLTRTPLWAAEHLTKDRLVDAQDMVREDVFYSETAIPAEERAELEDYARSGYDRGHLAPAADMPNEQAMEQSFSLANIIPQKAASNRGVWVEIENTARRFARNYGSVYVISGPIFAGDVLDALNGRVIVPTHTFKAIYVPSEGLAGSYIVDNSDSPNFSIISIDELTSIIGIDVFPTLPSSAKSIVPQWSAPSD